VPLKWLGLHFVNKGIISETTGNFYTKIFTMRHKGDYEDFIDYDEEDALALLKPANDLIKQIEQILLPQ
jgi:uncharacterized protein (UPF0332 family)